MNYDAVGSKVISEYLSLGTKCHTSGCSPWFEGTLPEYIKQSPSEYATTATNATGVNIDELNPFLSSEIGAVTDALASNNVDDDDPDERNDINDHIQQLERYALRDLEKFKNIITIKICDKSAGTFVVICKFLDMQTSWSYIDSVGDSYKRVLRPESDFAHEIARQSADFGDITWHDTTDPTKEPTQAHPSEPVDVPTFYSR